MYAVILFTSVDATKVPFCIAFFSGLEYGQMWWLREINFLVAPKTYKFTVTKSLLNVTYQRCFLAWLLLLTDPAESSQLYVIFYVNNISWTVRTNRSGKSRKRRNHYLRFKNITRKKTSGWCKISKVILPGYFRYKGGNWSIYTQRKQEPESSHQCAIEL